MGEIYQNEFAMVEVERRDSDHGARLCIRDLATGAEVYLDALELEGLTRWKHRDFAELVDPSALQVAGDPDPDEV